MTQRMRVSFELDRIALEGDELVVSGFWTGVQGMRFVRPTLLADDRRILATLEHKPWAPSESAKWTAAFPWTGGIAVDADSLSLAVAPKVIVPLGAAANGAPAVAEPAPAPDSVRDRQPAPVSAAARQAAATSKPAPRAAATKRARASKTNGASASAPPAPVTPVDVRTDELTRALATAERDRDRALAQLTEAIEQREAAVTARAGIEVERDEALDARETAETALAHSESALAKAESALADAESALADAESALASATSERQEAVAQRDEALVAVRALQRERQAELAQADRDARAKAKAKAKAKEDDEDDESDEPLGVRTVPAVRGLAELQYPRRESRLGFTRFDLWVVRLLAVAAAGCFFVLLYSILRVVV